MRVRVLVYNVKAFRFGVWNAATLVAEHAPDVALIQECGPRHRPRRFADAVGMEHVSEHFLLRRSIHNAVLVRHPWRVLSKRLHRFPRDVRFYPRGALMVRAGRPATACGPFPYSSASHRGPQAAAGSDHLALVVDVTLPS